MAGTALLPWECLLDVLDVAVRRQAHRMRRKQALAQTEGWPEVEGTVHSVQPDRSCPREEITYRYSTEHGYYSGFFWRWFDSSDVRNVQVGERLVLRYDPASHDKSVFLRFG